MDTPEEARLTIGAVGPLCKPLHTCGQRAWERADLHFTEHGMDDSDNKGGRAHLARYHLRHELAAEPAMGGWNVNPPRPNGEISLSLAAMRLRVLRPWPPPADMLAPPPGPNQARIDYYRNPPLTLFNALGSRLIAVWSVDGDTGEIMFRIVRTTNRWKPGHPPALDLDFVLPPSPDDLDKWEFVPNDAGMRLPLDDNESGENIDGLSG